MPFLCFRTRTDDSRLFPDNFISDCKELFSSFFNNSNQFENGHPSKKLFEIKSLPTWSIWSGGSEVARVEGLLTFDQLSIINESLEESLVESKNHFNL